MVQKPYIATLLTALVLLGAGLFSYFMNDKRPVTALIGPGFGVLLLLMVPGMKKENKVIAHIVVLLTLLFGLMTLSMAFGSGNNLDAEALMRRRVVFGLMSAVCLLATAVYVMGFIQKKKARKAAAGQA